MLGYLLSQPNTAFSHYLLFISFSCLLVRSASRDCEKRRGHNIHRVGGRVAWDRAHVTHKGNEQYHRMLAFAAKRLPWNLLWLLGRRSLQIRRCSEHTIYGSHKRSEWLFHYLSFISMVYMTRAVVIDAALLPFRYCSLPFSHTFCARTLPRRVSAQWRRVILGKNLSWFV